MTRPVRPRLYNSPPEPPPGDPLLSNNEFKILNYFFDEMTHNSQYIPCYGDPIAPADTWMGLPPELLDLEHQLTASQFSPLTSTPDTVAFHDPLSPGTAPSLLTPYTHALSQGHFTLDAPTSDVLVAAVLLQNGSGLRPPLSLSDQCYARMVPRTTGGEANVQDPFAFELGHFENESQALISPRTSDAVIFAASPQAANDFENGGPSERNGMVRRRRSTVQSTPGSSAGPSAVRAMRENLSEEQKRENHIRSEQKRRTLIRQGFEDLSHLVPGIKGGGFSKSIILTMAADWLEDLLNRNHQLEARLLSLRQRE